MQKVASFRDTARSAVVRAEIRPSEAATLKPNSGAGVSALTVNAPTMLRAVSDSSKTSRTAIFAALGRAEQALYGMQAGLPTNGADAAVAKLVPQPYRSALLPGVHNLVRKRTVKNYPGSYGHVYARTLYFDQAVKAAIKDGATQVVILGAGFDTRGVRLKTPGVTTFEVDLPATQAEKIKRLDAAKYDRSSIRFVPLDLDRESLAESLVKQGFDRKAKTCVIAEGLTFYIDANAFNDILKFVKRDCGPGTSFAFDSIDESTANGTTTDADARQTIETVRKGGEPFRFGLKRGAGETAKVLGAAGLSVTEDLTPAGLEQRYGLDTAKAKRPELRVGAFYGIHLAHN